MSDKGHARVPVKMCGTEIGHAIVYQDGTIVMQVNSETATELFDLLVKDFCFGLTVNPILNPAIDGKLISRTENQRPLSDFGGFQITEGRNQPDRF